MFLGLWIRIRTVIIRTETDPDPNKTVEIKVFLNFLTLLYKLLYLKIKVNVLTVSTYKQKFIFCWQFENC
jgi:hypothetical protein